ncbi:MAG: single-stranded DNA-binding protein [Bacteroidales bacterium]|nr:single-stranded DNA-binding protein [Bacteroidales bacterium]
MKTWNSVNLLFFVGLVVDRPKFSKTKSDKLIAEARIQVDERFGQTNTRKKDVLLDIIAFDKNALALNVVAQPGAVIYLECHLTNILVFDKYEIKIVADKFQILAQPPWKTSYVPLDNKTLIHEIKKRFGSQELNTNVSSLLEALDPTHYGIVDEYDYEEEEEQEFLEDIEEEL